MKSISIYVLAALALSATACKKKGCTDSTANNFNSSAKKDDGSCTYTETYAIPSTYSFTDNAGNSTVDFSGQTERVMQLDEMITYAKTGTTNVLDYNVLKAMFENTNGNANGNFSFSSVKQLKDKCFALDTALVTTYLQNLALASQSNGQQASNGQAGILTSGSSTYLIDANGFHAHELVEKAIMGAVFQYQSLNVYFSDAKMNVDNTTAVNANAGQFYTQMEHHFDEAFGYFGVPVDFPATAAYGPWGEYCNSQDATIQSNSVMMNNFRKGRAAISNKDIPSRDAAILALQTMWEKIAAYQAMRYLDLAATNFGVDQGKYLHVASEAYGFIYTLRFAPLATRKMTTTEVDALLNQFGGNLWNLTLQDIQYIRAELDSKY